ncbi:helix-turn-helix domain-containing protein [Nocardia sp. NPDC050413]|uniref:helix-turn-helix domain-containing protein n=1 Tax=Nocardia sp. NPDC050413 TaxID=3155784 RepID=UPI0033C4F038
MSASPPTDRVVSVVELLAAEAPLTAASVADRLALSRSTVAAILTTLESRGWAQRSRDLTYRLGPTFPTAHRAAAPAGADAALRELARRVGCGAALSVVSSTSMTFVGLAAHHGRVPAGIEVGARVPLRAPAGASVIAFCPPERQHAWLATADPGRRHELTTALTEIRTAGLVVWGIDPADLATLDVLAEVAGHLAHSPASGPLRRRVLGLLGDLSGYPHTAADLAAAAPLPIAYLAAPVFDRDEVPRWELQIGPLHPAVSPGDRELYRTELLACAQKLGVAT